tara:strand:- start:180 stop:659 length:480 start_codon:yes stop_codon:yes gene_type:complete
MSDFYTADICDEYEDIQICQSIFKSYGGKDKFNGKIRTVTAIEDNSYVKKLIDEKVSGDIMVVDGNGSMKCALLGDNLAKKAAANGWSGFIINGCIRDSEIISTIDIGIKALSTMPLKSEKKNVGEFGKDLKFANVSFKEGHYAYSDQDGIIIRQDEII